MALNQACELLASTARMAATVSAVQVCSVTLIAVRLPVDSRAPRGAWPCLIRHGGRRCSAAPHVVPKSPPRDHHRCYVKCCRTAKDPAHGERPTRHRDRRSPDARRPLHPGEYNSGILAARKTRARPVIYAAPPRTPRGPEPGPTPRVRGDPTTGVLFRATCGWSLA